MYIIGSSVTDNNVELLGTGYLYAPVIFNALREQSIFIPGVTYNDEVSSNLYGSSASIEIPKFLASGLESKPGVAGRNFSDNSVDFNFGVVTLKLCNNHIGQKHLRQEQLMGAYVHQSSSGAWTNIEAAAMLDLTENKVRDREKSSLGSLINASEKDNLVVTVTSSNVKDIVLDARAKMSCKYATPDVVLCSPSFYNNVVSYAGRDFNPMLNEQIALTGRVGKWLGMLFVECQYLNGTTNNAYYVDPADCTTLKYVPLDGVNFVMYDHRAFNIQDCLLTARVINAENSSSILVQLEFNSGCALTDSRCSLVSWSNTEPVEATLA